MSGTMIGPESNDEHEVTCLNRILRLTAENMMSHEADPQACPVIAERMELGRSKRGSRANNQKFGRWNMAR